MSTSWGHCESVLSGGEASAIRTQVQRMVAAGATISASSGDNGDDDCGNSTQHVDFPASVPEVVAVGGTSLTNGYQTAWDGSGGGVEHDVRQAHLPERMWQAAACPRLSPCSPTPTPASRSRTRGGLATVGGTSLASPLFAGLLAGALSEHGSTTGVGDIHDDLYNAPARPSRTSSPATTASPPASATTR